MSIIEKAINKLETEKGRDALLDGKSSADNGGEASDVVEAVTRENRVKGKAASCRDTELNRQPAGTTADAVEPGLQDQGVDTSVSGYRGPVHQLPLQEMSDNGMITPLKPRSLIADEYRAIKRPLLRNMDATGAEKIENANLIMVASALPGEGKTFSAINLAMSIATEQDKTVLLVDADVTKATAAKHLGVDDESPGLIDLLDGSDLDFSDVLIHTNIPKLRVLPAGKLHEHATELLASENMRVLVKELSERYSDRVIIFDSPPLLITNEATIIASLVGQVVFIVAANQTSQEAVAEAVQHIGDDKVIGLVLNKSRKNPLTKHAYGYGYSYGYGYGNSNTDRSNTRYRSVVEEG